MICCFSCFGRTNVASNSGSLKQMLAEQPDKTIAVWCAQNSVPRAVLAPIMRLKMFITCWDEKDLLKFTQRNLQIFKKKLESFHTFQNMIPYITAFVNPVFGIFFLGALWVAFRKKRQDSICATSWNRPSGFRSWRDNFWQPFSKGKLPQLLEFTAWILANCHFKKVPSHVVRVLFCQQPVTVTGVFL